MSPTQDEAAGREERISAIIASYLEGREAGNEQSQQEILERYPEFERELKEFFEDEAFVNGVFSPADRPASFGDDYQVLGEIGRGGMGIVYRAHQKSLEKVVAIKTITGGLLASPADIQRIHSEAQRAAGLRHPNIVTVHHVGEHQSQHFFVMECIEGQSLAELVAKGPLPSAKAAQYVKTIAEAIHHAHQRQILHCDLKPANILLDEEGKPYVTDFGLAKRMGDNARYLPYSVVGGTASYMAPEQLIADELTTATDVYGLGGILYALLTGSAPFQAKTMQETLRQVRDEAPTPPSKRNPKVDKDLEVICLKCLNKDRDQRYGSAYGVAMDLGRYQAGDETVARPWSRGERRIRWCRRNPVVAALISAMALISILTVAMAVSIAKAAKDAQLQEAIQSNNFAARDLARTALLQLRDLRDVAEAAARDSTLSDLLAKKNDGELQHYLEGTCRAGPIPFASCTILNADGIQLARVGDVGAPLKYDFSWRDYFRGARDHRELQGRSLVHISKVYRSKIDDLFKFAISVPVLDARRRFLGVITTSVTTDAAIGRVILEDPRRKVALVAPKDIEDPATDSRPPDKAVIVFHPGYYHGIDAVEFPKGTPITEHMQPVHGRELFDSTYVFQAIDDYKDPVGTVLRDYGGRWIAGFAPVGNTGFVVIVQQRYEEALKLDPSTLRNLFLWSGVAVVLAVIVVVLVLWLRPARH